MALRNLLALVFFACHFLVHIFFHRMCTHNLQASFFYPKHCRIHAIAVFSDADKYSKHVRLADEAFHIVPSKAKDSYLSSEKILNAALKLDL